MTTKELQALIGTKPDGAWGPNSQAALSAHFSNPNAAAVTDEEIAAFADMIGCTPKQVRAVAKVESSGSGFDRHGRPKILYERHLFHRLTDGRWSVMSFSNPAGGGYSEDSWAKLGAACGKDPDAAFSACSWGKFQVLGTHWSKLGYESPYSLAHAMTESEANHYLLLVQYVVNFGLADEMRAISTDPEACRPFSKGYNGPAYTKFKYHYKLAEAMR